MPNLCNNLKEEYESFQRLTDKYIAEYLRVRDSGDMTSAKQLKKELKQRKSALEEKFWYPAIIYGSIKRIIKELNLNVKYVVDDEGKVQFKNAKENIAQIISILTHKKNKIREVKLMGKYIGDANMEVLNEVFEHPNHKVTSIEIEHNSFD